MAKDTLVRRLKLVDEVQVILLRLRTDEDRANAQRFEDKLREIMVDYV